MPSKRLLPILMLSICTFAWSPLWAAQRGNGASAALLEAAALQLEFGEVEQAGDTLERALRIEPNNPAILHALGQVRLRQGQYEQAVALAARSNAHARNDAILRQRNLQLLDTARQAMGPGIATGQVAEVQRDESAEVQVGLDRELDSRYQAGIAAAPLEESAPEAIGEEGLQKVSTTTRATYGEVDVPRSQLPPRGKCRIWFPDRPPGHQPAPGKCKDLQRRVPAGAYLLRG